MTSNEQELYDDYTRTREEFGKIMIEVAVISWLSPHAPTVTWHIVFEIPADSEFKDILKARRMVLKRKRYFKKCRECGELNADGHMYDNHICQGCAEQIHGVVF